MKLTKHAKARSQQRGIGPLEMKLILKYGKQRKLKGNAVAIEVDGRTKNELIGEYKSEINRIDNLTGKVIVLSDDGSVLTTYHKKEA